MFSSEFMNIFLFNLMYNLPHGLDQFLLQDYKSQESSWYFSKFYKFAEMCNVSIRIKCGYYRVT